MLPSSKLTNEDISRYSRQLILPELGVGGQLKLKTSKVLVVGAGGLGCPAAAYLAAAGVGTVGVVDHDVVELDNLHRQIMHSQQSVGLAKSSSLGAACNRLNASVQMKEHNVALSASNAEQILAAYDVVLDCTDNAATRYLVNDACVLLKKPLVSGSALRFEGQLTVFNYNGGPCYRCVFPKPPPVDAVTNCSDGGVLGAVTGIIGSMQALEAVKIICQLGESLAGRFLVFDGLAMMFRISKLRPKSVNCKVCSEQATIDLNDPALVGLGVDDKCQCLRLLAPEDRISVQTLQQIRCSEEPYMLLDVRPAHEFGICRLAESRNEPLARLEADGRLADESAVRVLVICRRGNDSQKAVQLLRAANPGRAVHDVAGGLHAYSRLVDPNFPVY